MVYVFRCIRAFCAKCSYILEDIYYILTCFHNQIELKAIIEEAITKISKENEVEIISPTDLAQEIQNIHIGQQIPIGIITENLTNLEPLKRKLLPNIYHRIVKKIHKHIWKPSSTSYDLSSYRH